MARLESELDSDRATQFGDFDQMIDVGFASDPFPPLVGMFPGGEMDGFDDALNVS